MLVVFALLAKQVLAEAVDEHSLLTFSKEVAKSWKKLMTC